MDTNCNVCRAVTPRITEFLCSWRRKAGKVIDLEFLGNSYCADLLQAAGLQYGYRYVFFMAFFAQVAVSEASAIGVQTIIRMMRDLKNKTHQFSFSSVAVSLIAICTMGDAVIH